MTITSARWTPRVNLLTIRCSCGRLFEHRADRWQVRCVCGRQEGLGAIRERYREEGER